MSKSSAAPSALVGRVPTDRDAVYMNKSGLRLRVGDRQFFIYEHIGGYAHLLEQLQRKVAIQ